MRRLAFLLVLGICGPSWGHGPVLFRLGEAGKPDGLSKGWRSPGGEGGQDRTEAERGPTGHESLVVSVPPTEGAALSPAGLSLSAWAQEHPSATASPKSAEYLKLRMQRGVVQPVGSAALRETKGPRVVELAGKPVSACQVGDATILTLEFPGGDTQEIEAKAMPDWLAATTDPVRLLVRASRPEKALKVEMLAAAPEIDVLPAEEAYWRAEAEKRRLAARRATINRPAASRGAARSNFAPSPIHGRIGRYRASSRLPGDQLVPIYAAFIQGQNSRLPYAKASSIARDLVRFSLAYGVEARLVLAILIVESGFDPNAVSHSGAVGLGQLMPGTARWMGVRNSYDTTENLYGMIKLLSTLSRQFKRAPSDPIVLAAYNAGDGAVRRHGGVPPFRETQAYVRRVGAYFRALCGES